VPLSLAEAERYIDEALTGAANGSAVPFAVVRNDDHRVIGSTRFFQIERWAWPANHPRTTNSTYDGVEIGYTWYSAPAIRTAVNTEAKYLMLRYAFEEWRVLRVCLHTDVRNERSRAAIERIGGVFEGVLRAHRIAADFTPRDSARYSIIADEWPAVRERLEELRSRYEPARR